MLRVAADKEECDGQCGGGGGLKGEEYLGKICTLKKIQQQKIQELRNEIYFAICAIKRI